MDDMMNSSHEHRSSERGTDCVDDAPTARKPRVKTSAAKKDKKSRRKKPRTAKSNN
jgi:hypothetical protein